MLNYTYFSFVVICLVVHSIYFHFSDDVQVEDSIVAIKLELVNLEWLQLRLVNAGGSVFTQVRLKQDIHSTKGDLNETNSNIIATNNQLSQLETGTSDSISKVHKDILFFYMTVLYL